MKKRNSKNLLTANVAAIIFLMTILFLKGSISVNAASSRGWVWPTSVHTIKNDWPNYSKDSYHGGTDFPVSLNTKVYSSCDGEVVTVDVLTNASGNYVSYGKYIRIKAKVNNADVYMLYCHLNSFAVSKGQKVKAGQLIGYSGSTGNSSGPHLHYEVRDSRNSHNYTLRPADYLPGTSLTFYTDGSAPNVDPDPAINNPIGNVDIVSGGTETIRVAGWAYDRDVSSKSIGIHVYVGGPAGSGAPGFQLTANVSRNDVNKAHGITGQHGFDKTISVNKTGSQTIYIYAINEGKGNNNPLIGKKTVTINKKITYVPQGHVDLVTSDSSNKIRVRGWAFDRDLPSKSLSIHVYVGGPAGSGAPGYCLTTLSSRPDVNNAYKITGTHGFDKTISVSKTGKQTVYIYAINVGGGNSNTLIGSKTVTIKGGYAPQGCIDLVTSNLSGTIRLAGWAFDKDVPTKSIVLHVYVGGPAGSGAPVYGITANTNRPDVNKVYNISGKHGFDQTIKVSRRGDQTIYIYAINQGGGSGNPLIGKKTIRIK